MVLTYLQQLKNSILTDQKSDSDYPEAVALRESERHKELQSYFQVSLYFIAPIYLVFWFCDWIYAPHLKWEFLFLRSLLIPFTVFSFYINKRTKSFNVAQANILFFAFVNSFLITLMIFLTEFSASPYYAGLNLVCIGAYGFISWKKRNIVLPLLAMLAPYYAGSIFWSDTREDFKYLVIHSFFIFGTAAVSLIIYFFREKIQLQSCLSRIKLEREICDRNKIIEIKTKESVRLESLSQQFSPQVVKAIQNEKINIEEGGVNRSKICSIFIDIVNSTERVTRIDEDKVNKVISFFMEDCTSILLKYDITIDKFLGDGILAFSNAPVTYDDYISRVVLAAIEIREKIQKRQYLYESYWLNELQICIGIASGYANVGFYGGNSSYHSYTAIGPVVNLSSRLCSIAEPNQIVASYDVLEALDLDNFEFSFLGKKKLKGFEDDLIKTFSITKVQMDNLKIKDELDCPECGKAMHLGNNDQGIYVFKCRSCGYVNSEKEDNDLDEPLVS